MFDFTLQKYSLLINTLNSSHYKCVDFATYCNLLELGKLPSRLIILRHDVDKKAWNSVKIAEIENKSQAKASYYFRIVPESNIPESIQRIKTLGHEIGYHYEDMSLCNGDIDKAKKHFDQSLAYFRTFYPVSTICMHGAPTSQYDGKDLWTKYNYHDSDIIGEPYFDVDFDNVFYLTDTGRRWDGYKVSVRDKVPQQELWNKQGLTFHSTQDIIKAIKEERFPHQVMITTHPQRWTDNYLAWLKELILQSVKNVIKRGLIVLKGN